MLFFIWFWKQVGDYWKSFEIILDLFVIASLSFHDLCACFIYVRGLSIIAFVAFGKWSRLWQSHCESQFSSTIVVVNSHGFKFAEIVFVAAIVNGFKDGAKGQEKIFYVAGLSSVDSRLNDSWRVGRRVWMVWNSLEYVYGVWPRQFREGQVSRWCNSTITSISDFQ